MRKPLWGLCGAMNLQLSVYAVLAISGRVWDQCFHYKEVSMNLCETCILSFERVYNTSARIGITCENFCGASVEE